MSDYLSEDGTFINSLIGEGSFFKGDISLKGLLRIDGDFKGTITEGGKVLIGKTGRVEAMVSAGTVVIGGVLKGSVAATEKVVVLSTGLVMGNIKAPRLLVEDGVLLHGRCDIAEKAEAESNQDYLESTGKSFNFKIGRVREMETVPAWKK